MIPNVSTSGPYAGIAQSRDVPPSSLLQSELAKTLKNVCSCFDAELMLIQEKPFRPAVPGDPRQFVACDGDLNIPLYGTDMTPLWLASSKGEAHVVERILQHEKMDPNGISIKGETALHAAVRRCHHDVVKVLLNDSRTDVTTRNDKGGTVLEHFAGRGDTKMLRELLERPTCKIDDAERRKLTRYALTQQVVEIKKGMAIK
jgi:hypothetical protein